MTVISVQTLECIQYAAEIIRKSQRAVVLTGAGISTPSGIPDFRSEGTGLWSKVDPMEVASLNAFRYAPERFYEWIRPLATQIFAAEPNHAHQAFARLQAAGYFKVIITQNIDNLHQKAGSSHVLETHGTFQTMSCTQCFKQISSNGFIEPYIRDGQIPHCSQCGGILKPDIILFGEQLPVHTWYEAQVACRNCDLILVAGSSLEVLPVAGLPLQALDRGAHLIIANFSPTYLGVRADVVLLGDVAEIIPLIAERVLHA
jgi:NAD-dependent deacetylase